MARQALKSTTLGNRPKIVKVRPIPEPPTKNKKFKDLSNKEKDDLLKNIAARLGLLHNDDD